MTESVISQSNLQEWSYKPVVGHWDEAVKATGLPRPHWRKLAIAIARMGRNEFEQRWRTGQQLIQANGITYNVYGDPQGKERPWPLDPIPLMIGEAEWAGVEAAVAQRATLLNAMLADLHGPRRLLKGKKLPPALVFANPNFLRPAYGIQVSGGVHLHSYAVDIARSPDGHWWVIADRTQAPSGAGYALENRIVSARMLLNVFSRFPVRPLARYFQSQLDGLLALAPGRRRIVLLTAGPNNETYFEHSYLAKFWGLPLVEGGDLTVRDSRVFLKTLGGLEQVDFIFRRQDDAYCDPLELRGDSLLGVPGLLRAIRAGNVALGNALGAGLVETPAHMAFLPGFCRELLGEELRMPSVATWWCGQPGPRRFVLDHMRELVIKPAFPRFGHDPVFGADLTDAGRAALAKKIEARPEQYVAQEQVSLSSVPVWNEDGLARRHVVVRVYAAWDGEGYTIMPGGLTRVSNSSSSLVVSMQHGGGSKDTWVLGSPEEAPRASIDNVDAGRILNNLPSRVADDLFWLGRYSERLEAVARLARVLLPSLSGEMDFGQTVSLDIAIRVLTGYGYLDSAATGASLAERRRGLDRALATMIHDPAGAVGLIRNLKHVRRLSWQVKERLSSDTWRVLQQLAEIASPVNVSADQRIITQMNSLDQTIMTLSAFAGLLMESTTRGNGWHFVDIGRRLERALQMIELLSHGLVAAEADVEPYLEMLLQIADSSITYRSRYFTNIRADLVLDLLLTDETNPRALAFQLETLAEHVAKLPERDEPHRDSLENRLTLKALTAIRLARTPQLAASDQDGQRDVLLTFLRELREDLVDLSEALTGKYLNHVISSRLLSPS